MLVMEKMTRPEKSALRKATSKAGKASAAKLTPAQRKERASTAAKARWHKQ
jgi:hypothetical protein